MFQLAELSRSYNGHALIAQVFVCHRKPLSHLPALVMQLSVLQLTLFSLAS